MYIIVKNGVVLSHGINKQGWKYLDECKMAAAAACDDPNDKVEIYNLTEPEITYTLELITKEAVKEEPPTGDDTKPNPDEGTTPNPDEGGEEVTPTPEDKVEGVE